MAVGVPEISPVAAFIDRPVGKAGDTVQVKGAVPPVAVTGAKVLTAVFGVKVVVGVTRVVVTAAAITTGFAGAIAVPLVVVPPGPVTAWPLDRLAAKSKAEKVGENVPASAAVNVNRIGGALVPAKIGAVILQPKEVLLVLKLQVHPAPSAPTKDRGVAMSRVKTDEIPV